MSKLIILAFVLFSSASFAQNDLADISASNPNASRWEVLKEFYERSSSQAELSDFDKGSDNKSNQKCRLAFPKASDTLQQIVIRQVLKTIPGDGPLFPTQTIIKLNITNLSSLTNGSTTDSFEKSFAATTVTEDSYDLIIMQTKNEYHANSPFKLLLRKNGDMISFKLLTYKNNEDNGPLFEKNVEDSYGYCWRE